MPPQDESQVRAAVLRHYYQYYRDNPGDQLWSSHAVFQIAEALQASGTTISEVDVGRAIKYLSEKGLLRVSRTQSFTSGEPTMLLAEITGRGIDVFEDPETFPGLLPPRLVQQIHIYNGATSIVHGNQSGTIVQGNQQTVAGDNLGNMANGHFTALSQTFPATQLREKLAHNSEATAVVNQLDRELAESKPQASKVFAYIEALKAYANIADVGKILGGWLADPNVQQNIHFLTKQLWQ